tara:strand:- start:4302 stop:4550 length:249 start_codon:yes stop_codon:yes gene_type:complete
MSAISLINIADGSTDLTGIHSIDNGVVGTLGHLTLYDRTSLCPPGKDPNDLVKVVLNQQNDDYIVVYKNQTKNIIVKNSFIA